MYAKFSLSDPDFRAWAHGAGMYECEVRFYEQIAPEIELRTPRCYYSAINLETGASILLLEDLAPARSIPLAVGCSPSQAETAVRVIAKFHATWWDHPHLPKLEWLLKTDVKRIQTTLQDRWQPFLEKVGQLAPKSLLSISERFVQNVEVLYGTHSQSPQTFLHGDYQSENLLFATARGDAPLAVIDWHLARRGRGVMDVSYLLVTSLSPTDRKAHEMDFLRIYHRILVENGVQNYSIEQCLLDYRRYTLRALHLFISTVALWEGERMTNFYNTWAPRLDAALTDLKVDELLP
jgi:thiamine kinase-like enzyme